VQEHQSGEFSQGHIGKKAKKLQLDAADLKLPPLIDMACCARAQRMIALRH
jgi:hypothetical protein